MTHPNDSSRIMKMQLSLRQLFLVLAGLTLTACYDLDVKQFRNAQYKDVIFVANLTFESTENSDMRCAAQCSKRSYLECATFTFTPSSGGSKVGTCRGHSGVMTQGDQVMLKESSEAFHRVETSKPTCRSGWKRFGMSCYKFQAETIPYSQAQSQCGAMDSYLAEIESIEESLFVSNISAGFDVMSYIGLDDIATEGMFVLPSSGGVASFLYWDMGQPDLGGEDCVAVPSLTNFHYPRWHDAPCDNAVNYYASVCEYSLE